PTHIAFEGKFFDYEKGTGEPNRSFPGQDYRCRCYAKPAFPEDVDPHYSRKAEQERDKLKQQTEQAQVEFDDFYQRLTREAEETPYAEQGKPFIPSKIVATNEQLKEMFETTTKDFTETFEIDGTKLNQIIFREMIFQDAIKYQLEKDANGLPLVSGVYDSKDSLLAINLAETNKHITIIHELAYWLYDNYSFL
ncbi:MAG: hypothetical protein NZM26_05675, partial [Patescibacteria group bacterium]|nr:hypothetical protein [Patescibacteria group bacterium]